MYFRGSMKNTWKDWALRLAHELDQRNQMTYHAITQEILEKFANFAKEEEK